MKSIPPCLCVVLGGFTLKEAYKSSDNEVNLGPLSPSALHIKRPPHSDGLSSTQNTLAWILASKKKKN